VHYHLTFDDDFRMLKDMLSVSRDGKLINIKNELLGYWKEFHEKSKSNPE
jgi:hypothetical protein